MGLNLSFSYGQTPLSPEEQDDLKIYSISTKEELDALEQENIEEASQWILNKKFSYTKILSEAFIKDLHNRMYGNVWKWAGKFRNSEKNIGCKSYLIPSLLKQLLDDTLFWIENESYHPDEIAIRFKHRLGSIHCFPNGNGRHSRLMADIIISKIFNLNTFTWGKYNNLPLEDIRKLYIHSLREADNNNFEHLISFAKS